MSKADEKYIIKNRNNLILTEQCSRNEYNFSSVSLEDLSKYARGIKETQDIISDFYNYLTRFDSCIENREQDILDIIKLSDELGE